jgi:hypothetical protein
VSNDLAEREHPAAEKLSAYQANELPDAETDAIQEHVASCRLCAQRLLDLHQFLEFVPDRETVVHLDTVRDWRKLHRIITGELPRRLFRWSAVAAVLAAGLVWAVYQIVSLEREIARPVTDLEITTLEVSGSRKGEPSAAEPRALKLGGVIALDTHFGYPLYKLVFLDGNGRIRKTVEDTEDEDGMITLFLPPRFLPPGLYRIQVAGLRGSTAHPVGTFQVRLTR